MSDMTTAKGRLEAYFDAVNAEGRADYAAESAEREWDAGREYGSATHARRATEWRQFAATIRETLRAFYATSKYSDVLAEAGDAVILEGFAIREAGTVDGIGHYALVRLDDAPITERFVIIRTSSDGFVYTHASFALGEYGKAERMFDDISAEADPEEDDEPFVAY